MLILASEYLDFNYFMPYSMDSGTSFYQIVNIDQYLDPNYVVLITNIIEFIITKKAIIIKIQYFGGN